MAQKAQCPYGPHTHNTAKAFKKCQKSNETYVWDPKTGKRVIKGTAKKK